MVVAGARRACSRRGPRALVRDRTPQRGWASRPQVWRRGVVVVDDFFCSFKAILTNTCVHYLTFLIFWDVVRFIPHVGTHEHVHLTEK